MDTVRVGVPVRLALASSTPAWHLSCYTMLDCRLCHVLSDHACGARRGAETNVGVAGSLFIDKLGLNRHNHPPFLLSGRRSGYVLGSVWTGTGLRDRVGRRFGRFFNYLDVGSSVLSIGDFFLAFDGFLTVAATVTVCSMD